MGHREPVRQREEIVGQVRLVVEVQGRREPTTRAPHGIQTPESFARGVAGNRAPQTGCKELLAQCIAAAKLKVEVLVCWSTIARREEAFQTIDSKPVSASRTHGIWDQVCCRGRGGAPQRRGEPPVALRREEPQVPAIPSEQLITPSTGEGHFEQAANCL